MAAVWTALTPWRPDPRSLPFLARTRRRALPPGDLRQPTIAAAAAPNRISIELEVLELKPPVDVEELVELDVDDNVELLVEDDVDVDLLLLTLPDDVLTLPDGVLTLRRYVPGLEPFAA
ncbi:MAG: hypothetical protein V4579_09565 [Pseudomonadota bacterium]